jgi:hypothetical protein
MIKKYIFTQILLALLATTQIYCLENSGFKFNLKQLINFITNKIRYKNLPPIAKNGAALFTYVNNSGLQDSNVFIQVVGVNPKTGNQCFVKYDNQGNPTYYDVTKKENSQDFAYPLSSLQNLSPTGKYLYLPQLDGARIYTSINKKMIFLVVQNSQGVWTINAPNLLDPNDPNKNIIWDKTEFAVNPANIFINPTAVDNFSLPISCQETGKDGSSQGGGINASRQTVFANLSNTLLAAGQPWSNLISYAPSVVYSPVFAANVSLFDQDYLVTTGYIEAFKDYFSQNNFLIDASESLPVEQGGGIWQGSIDNSNILAFNRLVDAAHPPVAQVQLTLPTNISELIAGSGPSWKIEPNNVLQAVLARNLACAIDTNTLSTTEALGQKYFKTKAAVFYQLNPEMPAKLQFIDYYSKVLHSFGNHQIYTIPYDDELGQSGSASYVPQNFAAGTIVLNPIN